MIDKMIEEMKDYQLYAIRNAIMGIDVAKHCIEIAEKYKAQEQKWIPVEERLPEDFEIVNIAWINHNPPPYYRDIKDKTFVASGVCYRGKWYWYSANCVDYLKEYGDRYDIDLVDKDIEVIAWMPLPEYKEGDTE